MAAAREGLTLCLIAKNEEQFIIQAIAPVLPICEAVVVVDTGSSDGTIEIARELATTVLEHPFADDFSAARNAALEQVETEWVLFIDADEQFEPDQVEALAKVLRETPDDVLGLRVLRYNFFATGGFFVSPELKLFRSRPEIRYRRKINESVSEAIAEVGGRIEQAPLVLNHFGHTRPVADQHQKAAFYIRLMEEQLKENPRDAILHSYIGLILRTVGRFEEAKDRSERAVALDAGSPIVWFFHGNVMRATGDTEAALAAYRRAVELAPDDAAFWNMVGVMELTRGELTVAEEAFERALALQPLLYHVHINLGFVDQAQGDFPAALAHFEEAASRNPAFLRQQWHGLVERDPYRPFYYETILGYAGLAYHLGYCRERVSGAQ